ncbi:MAG: hypothetical protein IID45_01480, partial [Planctomycetes bacterium]|nr:hypothetical protein [Planctomycetota bacterium]
DGEWVDEDSICEPVKPGGVVCLQAERVLKRYLCDGQRPSESTPSVNILRLAGLYGPGRLLRRLREIRSRTPVEGNPQAFLNLIHVDDAAAAVLACEEHGKPGATYLICDDRPLTRREYFETLARLAGEEPPLFSHAMNRDNLDSQSFNKRCCNARMHAELQVELVYPDCQSGLRHALALDESQIDRTNSPETNCDSH